MSCKYSSARPSAKKMAAMAKPQSPLRNPDPPEKKANADATTEKAPSTNKNADSQLMSGFGVGGGLWVMACEAAYMY